MDAEVEMVRVVVQVGVQVAGAKDARVPNGSPETKKETACAVPAARVAVMVLEPEEP